KSFLLVVLITFGTLLLGSSTMAADGDANRGQRMFQNCVACHSLEPNKNLTGPSLSGVFGRKAGSLQSFTRYSDPMKFSGLTWDEKTLDAWLADPERGCIL